MKPLFANCVEKNRLHRILALGFCLILIVLCPGEVGSLGPGTLSRRPIDQSDSTTKNTDLATTAPSLTSRGDTALSRSGRLEIEPAPHDDDSLLASEPFRIRIVSSGTRGASSVVWGDNRWLLTVGDHFAYSDDGASFHFYPKPPYKFQSGVVWNGSAFVAVADGAILVSRNGIEWEHRDLLPPIDSQNVFTYRSQLVWAVEKADEIRVFHSEEGVAWEFLAQVSRTCGGVYFTDDYVVCLEERQGKIYVSHDQGNTWVLRYEGDALLRGKFVDHGGKLDLYVGLGCRLTTSDGIHWIKEPLAIDWGDTVYPEPVAQGVIMAGGEYFCLFYYLHDGAERVSSGILKSFDGIHWTVENTGYLGRIKDLAVDDRGAVLAVGADIAIREQNGEWVLRAPLEAKLGRPSWNGDRILIPENINDQGFVLETLDHGLSWRRLYVGIALESVAWSGNRYVGLLSEGGLVFSDDGKDWYAIFSVTTPELQSVNWLGDRFVAVGPAGAVATSTDGEIWSVNDLPDDQPYDAALGTANTATTTEDLLQLIWIGNRFVGLFKDNTLRQSNDGIAWSNPQRIPFEEPVNVHLLWTGTHLVLTSLGGSVIAFAE